MTYQLLNNVLPSELTRNILEYTETFDTLPYHNKCIVMAHVRLCGNEDDDYMFGRRSALLSQKIDIKKMNKKEVFENSYNIINVENLYDLKIINQEYEIFWDSYISMVQGFIHSSS